MGWDYESFIQKVWEARKALDPEDWFVEPPAAAFAGASWKAVLDRLPWPWRTILEAHRRRWPEAFSTAEARAKSGVMAVFRPETLLLVPIASPLPLPAWSQVAAQTHEGLAYPPVPPRVLPLLRIDSRPPASELPVHPTWLEAQFAAVRFSTCAFPKNLALASVFDPGIDPERRLARLTFLQAHFKHRLEPELLPANQCLVRALIVYKEVLRSLPPFQGPYLLVPMSTGLLFVGQGGDAVPVLLGGADDYRALLARAVPREWGPLLGLLPFDASGLPLEEPISWIRALARKNGVSEAQLRVWVGEAARQAKSSALGGALVVGKRVTGFVASPVVWRES